jgi:hypothetical protein
MASQKGKHRLARFPYLGRGGRRSDPVIGRTPKPTRFLAATQYGNRVSDCGLVDDLESNWKGEQTTRAGCL